MDEAFHAGEQALQAHTGQRERLAEVGRRIIRPAMPDAHRQFFQQLPWLLVGGVDASGQPWASALSGPPGFVQSPDPYTLALHARLPASDPLADALSAGARIGLLGLQAHTRRRNRANGRVIQQQADGWQVAINQSFGNCPKYIQPRQLDYQPHPQPTPPAQRSATLNARARQLIAQADTCFIASAHPDNDGQPAHGVDVSHRGGPAGFVHCVDEQTLLLPDYAGNGYFNSLGNLQLNPRAGLLWLDFIGGDMLWLAANSTLIEHGPLLAAHPGAARLLRLQVREVRYAKGVLDVREVGEATRSPAAMRAHHAKQHGQQAEGEQ